MPMVEFYVLLDENGDYVVGKDEDAVRAAWVNEIGDDVLMCMRCLHLRLDVPTPEPLILTATVPAEQTGPVELTLETTRPS